MGTRRSCPSAISGIESKGRSAVFPKVITSRAKVPGFIRGINLFEWRQNMKKSLMIIALGLAAIVIGAGLLAAQDPVVGSKDPESLFTSKDPKLNTNKQATMHIMRDLLEAGHWDEAPKWLTEKYIQHNPCCANGRQTVMTFFGGRGTP